MGIFTIVSGSLVVLVGIVFTAFSLSLPTLFAGQYLILSVILLSIGGFIISRGAKDQKFRVNKNVVKGIIIGIVAVSVYIVFMYSFTSSNSTYVMSNEGMAPVIREKDVILVDKTPFGALGIGDIAVFYDQDNKVIMSRVQKIMSEEPRVLETEGDAKPSTTRQISEDEYIGKVYTVIPQLGNYMVPLQIAIMIGLFVTPVVLMKWKTKDQPQL